MARRVYGDRQGQTDRIQEIGHGPTASISISIVHRPTIKTVPACDFFRVSIRERLLHAAPAIAWMLGVREA
jgi:hypothetical protein